MADSHERGDPDLEEQEVFSKRESPSSSPALACSPPKKRAVLLPSSPVGELGFSPGAGAGAGVVVVLVVVTRIPRVGLLCSPYSRVKGLNWDSAGALEFCTAGVSPVVGATVVVTVAARRREGITERLPAPICDTTEGKRGVNGEPQWEEQAWWEGRRASHLQAPAGEGGWQVVPTQQRRERFHQRRRMGTTTKEWMVLKCLFQGQTPRPPAVEVGVEKWQLMWRRRPDATSGPHLSLVLLVE